MRKQKDRQLLDVTDAASAPELLATIIDMLPVGLTITDDQGRYLFVNSTAATSLPLPGAGGDDAEALRQERVRQLVQSGKPLVVEEEVDAGPQQRMLLTTYKPVRIDNRQLLVSTSIDITERKRIEDELARRAFFDELTGLANRVLLEQHIDDLLNRTGSEQSRFALAFIDLDNFKHINDYYSHAVGDALLVKVARRIASVIRPHDMLARISGDEFVLLIDHVTDDLALYAAVERISEEVRNPIYIESFEVFTSASIGVSIYPEHGTDYEVLRRNADSAMYRVKSAAKGGVVFFDLAMGKAVAARMELEQRLRLAIRDCSFRCAFQPKVDIGSGDVVGLEALIRWSDSRGVISPPADFIGLAVELGVIDQITRFVLDECKRSLDMIDAAFGPQTSVSINVAAKQASDLLFMHSFADALAATGSAGRFMVEITEDAFVAKSHFQKKVLPMLRETGARVSIDDFGTGYSSLSVLADITADEVKVDRSFITDIHKRPRSQSVLRTIESLSHALGMSVVAEGIESFEELAYLKATTRIRIAQGYYFAKPFFLEDFSAAKQSASGRRLPETPREPAEGRARAASRLARARV